MYTDLNMNITFYIPWLLGGSVVSVAYTNVAIYGS